VQCRSILAYEADQSAKESFINNCNTWITSGGGTAALFVVAIACALTHPLVLHCIPPDAPNCHTYFFTAPNDQLQPKQLPKVYARVVDLFAPFIWQSLRKHVSDADTLNLDPLHAGLKRQNGFFESFRALKTIIFVSGNPETFARDAWFFKRQGWSVDEVQLVDQFPQTPHIEILAVFGSDARID